MSQNEPLKQDETLVQSNENIEKPKQSKRASTKASTKTVKTTTKKTTTRKTTAKNSQQNVPQEYYYYEPSFMDKVEAYFSDAKNWLVILIIIFGIIFNTLILPAMFSESSSESDNKSSYSSNDSRLARYRGEWIAPDGSVWLNFINDEYVVVTMGDEAPIKREYALVGSHTGVIFYDAGSVLNLSPDGMLYCYDKHTGRRTVELMQLRRR